MKIGKIKTSFSPIHHKVMILFEILIFFSKNIENNSKDILES